MSVSEQLTVAAIVPCHNEEATVQKVVTDLQEAVPGIVVYVYDNNSTDRTSELAAAAGAIVRQEHLKGKGNVVRRAFSDIDADIYLMIDGDDTYDAHAAGEMIDTLLAGPYDHVLGVRKESAGPAYRPGHELGNRAFNWLVTKTFGLPVTDMLSGYRVMSRRFVKSFPALSREFEIETELTVHVMSVRIPHAEVPVGFRDRPEGSESKLRTYHDGFRILSLIGRLVTHERPLFFYGWLGILLCVIAAILAIPLFVTYWQTGDVPRFPTAVAATGIVILGCMSFMVGFVLDGVLRTRREFSRLHYLSLPAVR